jgi:hypothetical protein
MNLSPLSNNNFFSNKISSLKSEIDSLSDNLIFNLSSASESDLIKIIDELEAIRLDLIKKHDLDILTDDSSDSDPYFNLFDYDFILNHSLGLYTSDILALKKKSFKSFK